MKKIYLILCILIHFITYSQRKIAEKVSELIEANIKFDHFSIFEITTNTDKKIKTVVDNASFAKIKLNNVNNILDNKYDFLELEIPYNNQIIEIQMYKVDIYATDFHADTDKSVNVKYEKGLHYRGVIKGDLNSLVSFNFFKNECNGQISSNIFKNIVVGKLQNENNTTNYIIYKDTDLKIANSFNCQTKSDNNSNLEKIDKSRNNLSTRCVTFYFEIDYDLYQQNGSSTTATINWMASNFNNVQTIYNNDGIIVGLKSTFIWTNPDIYSTLNYTSSEQYLYRFHEERPVFDGDLGQLVGIDSGGLGGVAVGLNGLCTNNNFSYSDVFFDFENVPIFSWNTVAISHEFGHLMGSAHTHDCAWNGNETRIDNCGPNSGNLGTGNCVDIGNLTPSNGGTIMSYCHLTSVGINFANGFGPQPAARILAKVNGSSCLSTDCVNTCTNDILSSTVSNVTTNSGTITWIEQGGGQTSEVAIYPLSATTGVYSNPTVNNFTGSNLLPNTYYKAVVRKLCSGGLSGPEISKIFVTSGDFCSGISLTDSGGDSKNYLDNEDVTRIIIPANPFAKAKITFTAFDLEADYDYLKIFDGNNTTFPEISGMPFGYSGAILPTPYESTATDGALTIKFTSDGGVVNPGYVANISCNTLSNSDFQEIIDFSYSPNPTNDSVSILSKTAISEIAVYNIAGQLLFLNKLNNLRSNIDLSGFASGPYFFKLKFNEKEVHFKIMKL